ncbi:isoprenyl transferase [Geminicoccus flavidas]|uniref:isoprenyl transferase n=1 Tax=Geminicoccus flavidas TaxID=2506407 RepID=UPI0038B2325A
MLPSSLPGPASSPPVHVAIIMDGNRRWARARGMPGVMGHRRGADSVRRAIRAAVKEGVRYLTLFAFSSENWRRPAMEVNELMNLLRFYLRKELTELHKEGVRVRVIGDRSRLADDIRLMLDEAEALTAGNARLDLVLALNYGARWEITQAVRQLVDAAKAGHLEADAIDEALITRHLATAEIPDPDLLIRTSGEQRISNFLLWQLAYTEIVFLDVAWPDFDEAHFRAALAEFARRDRRFGASSSAQVVG